MDEDGTKATKEVPAHAFDADAAQAVYRAIYERRDMRHFSGGVVADEVLRRLLGAAHHAPSVGFIWTSPSASGHVNVHTFSGPASSFAGTPCDQPAAPLSARIWMPSFPAA